MNYQQAAAELARSRTGRRRIRGRSTYLESGPGRAVKMVYHNTAVVTWNPCGAVVLRSGGWHSTSTLRRLNRTDGVGVFSRRNEWTVVVYRTGVRLPFTEGMVVRP